MTKPFKSFKFSPYPDGAVTQYFGENQRLYSQFGLIGHNGIDFVAPHGTPLFAVEGGKVVDVKDNPDGFGRHIRILSNKKEWTYGHLSYVGVTLGQELLEGDYIGNMGNTGFVVSGPTPYWQYNPFAGTHLHLGCRLIRKWDGTGQYNYQYSTSDKVEVLNYMNGYKGAVDFALDFKDVAPEGEETEYYLTLMSVLNYFLGRYRRKQQGSID